MDENEFHDVEERLESETPTPEKPITAGMPWGASLLLIWALALVVFSVQNADQTSLHFLGWDWEMPVALLVMITALVTLVLTGIGAAFFRRRRRQRRAGRRALKASD